MIHVVATIEVKEGTRDQLIADFKTLVPLVLAEEGCIQYDPTIDAETSIELQTADGANCLTVVEKWESEDALKKHLEAPHMNEHRKNVGDLVTGIKIKIYESVC
jgi:quinol monooxygenase YgiN